MKVIAVIIIATLSAAGIIIHETGVFIDGMRGDDEYADRE